MFSVQQFIELCVCLQPINCVLVHFSTQTSGLISLQNKMNPQSHIHLIPHSFLPFQSWLFFRGSRPLLSSFALFLTHSGTQWKSALCPRVRVLHHLLPQTDLLSNRVLFHFLFSYFYGACRGEDYTVCRLLLMMENSFCSVNFHTRGKPCGSLVGASAVI